MFFAGGDYYHFAGAKLTMLFILHLLLLPLLLDGEPLKDKDVLFAFLSRTPYTTKLDSWKNSTSVCQWRGVTCNADLTSVEELRLPAIGLFGSIPLTTVCLLSGLRVLSLRANLLSGSIPSEITTLSNLRYLYLQRNNLSGEIPAGISNMTRLVRLDLSKNRLTGKIPVELVELRELRGLFLENNNLSGEIFPGIDNFGEQLTGFNVSYNQLSGEVPERLGSMFTVASFAGNPELCGSPFSPCSPSSAVPTPSPNPSTEDSGGSGWDWILSKAMTIGIAVSVGFLILMIIIVLLILRSRKRRSNGTERKPNQTLTTTYSSNDRNKNSSKSSSLIVKKMVVFENGPYSFDMEDLLHASAEVLGKGALGTSYKVILEDGNVVVVKRINEVPVSEREFEQIVTILGNANHAGIVSLRAYYYAKNEKLLVYDYEPVGSLSGFLHGTRDSSRVFLDWTSRARIALSAAKGLYFLHSLGIVHGDVKASNILLKTAPANAAAWSDFGLCDLFKNAANVIGQGYRAPELVGTRKVTMESDAYGFGVVLLELLTGKAANRIVVSEVEEMNLPKWVQSIVAEEWTAEVFDDELVKYGGSKIEFEMLEVLHIAMACVKENPKNRANLDDVVRVLQEITKHNESSEEPSLRSTPMGNSSLATP
ncbi:Receptor-like protein kinase 1-like [Zostera marina]|uniref:Receptor-like protein kinase 1-like n=1 Tax=Zostera marina TaxID=29655 RepID=A0A0K9NIS4_ZOSMR|nr:Receptor-like protein kinase 1-like [Zostera marina]